MLYHVYVIVYVFGIYFLDAQREITQTLAGKIKLNIRFEYVMTDGDKQM